VCSSSSEVRTAVGTFYPLASLAAGQDAAGESELLYRWGAMGHDGAQEVGALEVSLAAVSQPYAFAESRFVNVDCNEVVRNGGPPSGAHSDIFHPELGWLAVSAAGLLPATSA